VPTLNDFIGYFIGLLGVTVVTRTAIWQRPHRFDHLDQRVARRAKIERHSARIA
jgi:hypothetical protein